ncbi:aminoglycoside phosphotransferase family protein [Paenibacillus mendelii]|uniref:Phosphotransferase n=1 Tax=Paenibacillus mendelii TaxID=206163 RepID=A0ABV6JCC9_9BACL|nr:aminoglycoside phosphotransferase family protein [Paenibacillus mendelii]MCQ6561558.1 aminoglycoside phosphotransferase family protein [Paenibacillus mendelii]
MENKAVLAHFTNAGILDRIVSVTPITTGASGASVLSISTADDEFILKHIDKTSLTDPDMLDSFRREFHFYSKKDVLGLQVLPEIRYLENSQNTIAILMRKYETIPSDKWESDMTGRMVDLLTDVHACPADKLDELGIEFTPRSVPAEQIESAMAEWRSVLAEHNGVFDQMILCDIAYAFHDITAILNAPPHSLNHGDFHAANILLDEGRLLLCDWQNVSAGKGIGELSFFISRLHADGVNIDEEQAIRMYSRMMHEKTGMSLTVQQLKREKAAAAVSTSFLHWANYLHHAEADRVGKVYREMCDAYEQVMRGDYYKGG